MRVDEIKLLLDTYHLAPLKKLGQHFLINDTAIGDIVKFAQISRDDTIIEIGPGLGILTEKLAERSSKVVAVEIDKGFAGFLRDRFKNTQNVGIVHQDILAFSPPDSPYKVVGNLPYNISSAILEKFLRNEKEKPELLLITVQKEFALRMNAKTPFMNRLALLTQYYASPRIVASFPPHFFWPQPSVHSSLVSLTLKHSERRISKEAQDQLWEMTAKAFREPRKMLKNTLPASIGSPFETKRPSELSLEEWVSISKDYDLRN